MEKTVQELKENCNGIYFPESQTNNKCQTYATSYEEMVNYFINDITQVNQNIEEYNKYNQENATGIPPISKYSTTKDYIDFNGDKEYAGKEDFQDMKEQNQIQVTPLYSIPPKQNSTKKKKQKKKWSLKKKFAVVGGTTFTILIATFLFLFSPLYLVCLKLKIKMKAQRIIKNHRLSIMAIFFS